MVKSKQRGFTLIELVVVIVILGILAAFAVPKFMGLEQQARISALKGLAGGLRGAVAMSHGVWLANANGAATITVNGQAVPMSFGYPTRAVLSINALMENTSGFTYTTGNGRYTVNGAATANCYVVYTAATSTTVPPTVSFGTLAATATDAAILAAMLPVC
jgi:MSHA pilin protein MshA